MVSVLIVTTLAVVCYSLWVRRGTWWSRWEIGVTVAVALEGIALMLLSPWASDTLGPLLYRAVGLWNIQHLFGWICVILAIAANCYHVLVRIADPHQARILLRRHLRIPIRAGIAAMAVLFVIADEHSLADGMSGEDTGVWFDAYWMATGALLIFLSIYAGRLLRPLKADPRAADTCRLYLASSTCAVAAFITQIIAVCANLNGGALVWGFACLSVGIFAFGSAQSWRAKAAWFTPARPPVAEPAPEREPPHLG